MINVGARIDKKINICRTYPDKTAGTPLDITEMLLQITALSPIEL
jgi:hypothetical protein